MSNFLERFEKNLRENCFAEDVIPGLVEFEAKGVSSAVRVGSDWCRCEEIGEDTESYYRRETGSHGWFHDPRKGGCGGITQTG